MNTTGNFERASHYTGLHMKMYIAKKVEKREIIQSM